MTSRRISSVTASKHPQPIAPSCVGVSHPYKSKSMNISQQLRTCAKHTALDAVIELLNEAADEIDALQARAQVHTAQAEVTDDVSLDERFRDWIVTIKDAHDNSLDGEHASSRSMLRGVISEMEEAHAILALRPVQVPMTDGEILHQLNKISDRIGSVTRLPKGWLEFARAIEEWHGITAQAKKETP